MMPCGDKVLGNRRGKQNYIWIFRSVIVVNVGGLVVPHRYCARLRIEQFGPRVLCCDLKTPTVLTQVF